MRYPKARDVTTNEMVSSLTEDVIEIKDILKSRSVEVETISIKFVRLSKGDKLISYGSKWIVTDISSAGLRVCINSYNGDSKSFRNDDTVEKII